MNCSKSKVSQRQFLPLPNMNWCSWKKVFRRSFCWCSCSWSTDGAVQSPIWVHLLLTRGGAGGGGKGWFSTNTVCDNLERDVKDNPAVCSRVCLQFAGAHHPEHFELFMPALTLAPGSGLHCHADRHSSGEWCGWDSRGRGKIACTHPYIHQSNLRGNQFHSCRVKYFWCSAEKKT